MISTVKILAGAAALLATTACAGPDIERLRAAPLQGDPFSRTLAREYLKFATVEADEMDDWFDARHFARKGLRAASGLPTVPEHAADWRLPPAKIKQIADARKRLVEALDAGARVWVSERAAIAQARFDCWIEQQEENFQPDHIAACRDRFFAALSDIERAAGAGKPDTNAVLRESRYLVFFSHDATTVDDKARFVIRAVAAAARQVGAHTLLVAGHADRSGAETYNASLSQRRADAVRAALIRAGMRPERVSVTAHGESTPLVATGDGVREPKNRRAEIVLQ